MNIEKGFKIDSPDLFVSWDIDEKELIQLFKDNSLRHVTTGYYTASVEALSGLKCELGFHFEPRKNGRLKELEFFRTTYDDQSGSFKEFQELFERNFGVPTKTTKGTEGFQNHEWIFPGIQIVHFVFDRFGPEEHMRIKNIA